MMLSQMRFRAPGMSTRQWRDGELRYRRFLARQAGPRDELFTFFGNDFFHDGPVENIYIQPERQHVSLRIQANWIQPKDPDERRRVGTLAAWFQCEFSEVVWCSLATVPIPRLDPFGNQGGEDEYLYSEINTLGALLRLYRRAYRRHLRDTERDFRSLTILLGRSGRTLSLVFTGVAVTPEEPVAWSRLLTSDAYDTGLYDEAVQTTAPTRRSQRRGARK